MHPLVQRLSRLIEGVPEGGAVTLPREAVAGWLEEVGAEGGETAAEGRRDDVADLTVPEIAEALEKSESAVRGWMPDVDGAYKLGGQWRVPRAAWRAHLDSLAEDEDDGPAEVKSRPGADLGDWEQERRAS